MTLNELIIRLEDDYRLADRRTNEYAHAKKWEQANYWEGKRTGLSKAITLIKKHQKVVIKRNRQNRRCGGSSGYLPS